MHTRPPAYNGIRSIAVEFSNDTQRFYFPSLPVGLFVRAVRFDVVDQNVGTDAPYIGLATFSSEPADTVAAFNEQGRHFLGRTPSQNGAQVYLGNGGLYIPLNWIVEEDRRVIGVNIDNTAGLNTHFGLFSLDFGENDSRLVVNRLSEAEFAFTPVGS